MTRYALGRLPGALATLVLASIVIFSLLRLVPGDPAAALAGPDATEETLAAIRHELGLDRPFLLQYVSWLGGVFTLDLGRSYIIGGEIGALVRAGLLNTAVLALSAMLIAIVLAFTAALLAVVVDRPWINAILTGANTAGLAIPTYVTGLVLVVVLAVLVPILPAGGTPPAGLFAQPDVTAQYVLMPALCLALPLSAAIARFLTEALRTELSQPYVTTARAVGISRRRIIVIQALPNAVPAALTVMGLQFGALLGGAVLVEAIFAWPGLGQLIEQAISGRDYPVVQVMMLVSVGVFIVVQLVTDVVHAAVDPRIRLGAEA